MKWRKAIRLAKRPSDHVPEEADRQPLIKEAQSAGVTNYDYIRARLWFKASSNPSLYLLEELEDRLSEE